MLILSGTTTIAVANTAVAFPSNPKRVKWIKIDRLPANLATVFVGDSSVATSGASAGWRLLAGSDPAVYDYKTGSNLLSNHYVNGTIVGDGVMWTARLE